MHRRARSWDFFKNVGGRVKAATGNVIDLKILLAVGIIGFTVLEVGANAATPVWVTLVIFSLNHFIEMLPPGAGTAQAAQGRKISAVNRGTWATTDPIDAQRRSRTPAQIASSKSCASIRPTARIGESPY
jgi:hypothetical protein